MILPDVRSSFGRSEGAMLVHLLAREGLDAAECERLLADRGIDPLLDHPGAARALAGGDEISAVPLPLLAYVLLRRSLLDAGVESRMLADYLSSLFVHFSTPRRSYRVAEHDDQEFHYLVDILARLPEAEGRRGFLLRAHLGNLSLWLAGLFPDWITTRVHRKGGPGLDYYEEMGRSGFAQAADDPFARRQELDGLYREAASSFKPMRRALNGFSDRFLTPAARSPVDRVLRQVRDSFETAWLEA